VTELPIHARALDWTCDDSEQALIARARRDAAAFAEIYRRHAHAITGYVYRRCGDAHAADDLVAEVFLAAMRALPRYRDRGVPLRAWLYRIATNTVNRWARRNTWRQRVRLGLERHQGEARAGESDPSERSQDTADVELARRALLSLSPHHQSVLALHYLEGLPVEEVALVLGCRVGTVKSRLSRAREALRKSLEERR
jgi:RNA polymerase sigma-70 factor (ECF subfamily)